MDSNNEASHSLVGTLIAGEEQDAIEIMDKRKSSKYESQKQTDAFQQNETCLCSNEQLTMDTFCILLSLAIIKFTKKNDNRLEEGNQLQPNEIIFRCLEIETELMWHVIPNNMLSSEQAFFLSLFSTSCALLNTMINAHKEDCMIWNTSLQCNKTNNQINTDDANPTNSETNNMATREFLPLTSDSETGSSSKDVKSGNILASCVGRRSRRKKRKKLSEKKQEGKTITKPQNSNQEKSNPQIDSDTINNKTVEKLENSIIGQSKNETVTIVPNADSHGIKKFSSADHHCNEALITDNGMVMAHKTVHDVKLIFVKVLIPNEQSGSISASFIPVINKSHHLGMGTRVRDVMAIISFKQKVVNPHEYAVYLLSFESKEVPGARKDQFLQSCVSSKTVPTTKVLEDIFHGKNFY